LLTVVDNNDSTIGRDAPLIRSLHVLQAGYVLHDRSHSLLEYVPLGIALRDSRVIARDPIGHGGLETLPFGEPDSLRELRVAKHEHFGLREPGIVLCVLQDRVEVVRSLSKQGRLGPVRFPAGIAKGVFDGISAFFEHFSGPAFAERDQGSANSI
jgi:hypothetical protein